MELHLDNSTNKPSNPITLRYQLDPMGHELVLHSLFYNHPQHSQSRA